MYRYILLLSFFFFAGCIAYTDGGYYRHYPYPYYHPYYDFYGSGYYRYERSHDGDFRRWDHDGRGGRGDREGRGDRGDRDGHRGSDGDEGRGGRGHR